MSISLKCSH